MPSLEQLCSALATLSAPLPTSTSTADQQQHTASADDAVAQDEATAQPATAHADATVRARMHYMLWMLNCARLTGLTPNYIASVSIHRLRMSRCACLLSLRSLPLGRRAYQTQTLTTYA